MLELLPPSLFTEEFHLDLHGSRNFYLDLHGVCINFIELAPNVLKSYLLLFIHKLMIFALTTNAIIVFILYLYLYSLKSLYLLEFIVVYIFIEVEYLFSLYFYCIYWTYVFISLYIYSYLLGWIFFFLLSNTCAVKFIERKFYLEGRACYIGKIMPTCIE